MDLADGGSGDGFVVKGGEEGGKVGAEIGGEDGIALGGGHIICIVLDAAEDFGNGGGKHFGVYDRG